MKSATFRRFGTIEKVEENEDGTVNVFGFASTEDRDDQGEIILASAMHEALPDYMKWGAIREMHQPKAAGTALEAEVDLNGTKKTAIGVHVVDPVAVTKVKTRVYKAFSIGGRVLERDKEDPTIVTKLKWVETSLVDRPANPGAEILIVKADIIDDKLVELKAGLSKANLTKGELLYLACDHLKSDVINDLMRADATFVELRAVLEKMVKDVPAAVATEPAPVVPAAKVEKVETPTAKKPLRKGMWSVSCLADLLGSLNSLRQSAEWEAAEEGDGSPVPAELKAAVEMLGSVLLAMVTEEVSELTADGSAIYSAAKPLFEKAGRRFSKSTQKELAGIHKAIIECCAGMEKLGYQDAEEPVEGTEADKIAKVTAELATTKQTLADLEKAIAAKDGDITKLTAERDAAAAKVTTLEEGLEKVNAEVTTMVEQFKAKGWIRAVAKVDDGKTTPAPADVPIDPKDPSAVSKAIKAVHAKGGTPLLGARGPVVS